MEAADAHDRRKANGARRLDRASEMAHIEEGGLRPPSSPKPSDDSEDFEKKDQF